MSGPNRRDFIRGAALLGAGVAINGLQSIAKGQDAPVSQGKYIGQLTTKPAERIRVGMVGLGMRGGSMLGGIAALEWVDIVAVSDKVPAKADRAAASLVKRNRPEPTKYSDGPDAWKKMCERDDIDVIYISTPWEQHTPMCVYAMEHGKHAFSEVPVAVTMEECWQLVDTAEKYQKHCAILENCCYGSEELMILNMVKQGLFGTLVHGEGAYIHDLRDLHFSKNGYQDMWRLEMCKKYGGNHYPTHGLGPVAWYMDINRGDKFDYMNSMSTNQIGMTEYAIEKYGKDSEQAKTPYKLGDMNTSVIKTALGRTIMVQHDVTSPRPYSRINMLSGTKGIFYGYPNRVALSPKSHDWINGEEFNKLAKKYAHPLWLEVGELARKNGGHGGMDFIMLYRLFSQLRDGKTLDLSVYDAAAWSSIFPLSIQSINNRSNSVDIPDFTRGNWKTTPPIAIG